eukprot:GHVP01031462.1.p2 GENE.GHVP01031462.1~~GHVP01031462.1.p2  ORF type:complete len:527 (+),score=92.71 GHVP01031462.1:3677-5257(+)
MNKRPNLGSDIYRRNLDMKKEAVGTLLEKLTLEICDITKDASEIRKQCEELELRLKLQFSEVVVMHKHFLELRQEYLRTKKKYEEEIYTLRLDIQKLGGTEAIKMEIPDTLSKDPPLAFNDIYSSKEKRQMIKAITRRGRSSSELLHVSDTKRIRDDQSELASFKNTLQSSTDLASNTATPLDSSPPPQEDGSDWLAIHNSKGQKNIAVELRQTIQANDPIMGMKFSKCGKYIALICDRLAIMYDWEKNKKLFEIEGQDRIIGRINKIRSMCFSNDSEILYLGGDDKKVRAYIIKSKKIIVMSEEHTKPITSITVSYDDNNFYSGSLDNTIIKWNSSTGSITNVFGDRTDVPQEISTIDISIDEKYLVAGSTTGRVTIWNSNDPTNKCILENGHTECVSEVKFLENDGKIMLLTASLDRTVRLWLIETENNRIIGKCTKLFKNYKESVMCAAVSSDNTWIVAGTKDKAIQLTDLSTGIVQLFLKGHKGFISSVDFNSQNQNIFASGSADNMCRIWKLTKLNNDKGK